MTDARDFQVVAENKLPMKFKTASIITDPEKQVKKMLFNTKQQIDGKEI